MQIEKIAFLGFADSLETDPEYKEAYLSAKLLAENGYTLVDGGGPGVMEAATLGAHAGGGKAIGVTLVHPTDMPHFEGPSKKNNFDSEVQTHSYVERTLKLLEISDVYVIFNGGTGTISEFGMAWGLARLHFGHHKPLVLYGSWWHEIIEAFGKNMHLRAEELEVYHIVTSPEEVLMKIRALEASSPHDYLRTKN